MNLKGRNFLKLMDYTPEEILYLIDLAADLKSKKKQGILHDSLIGKNIALIFEKTSTRTRCSFEVAAHDLGMHVTYLDPSGSQIGKKESIRDTARVLGRMFEGIEYRGYGQEIVEELVHADITTRIKDIAAHGSEPKVKTKKYDEVDLAQMSLFDTVKDDDVLKELKELDVSNLTPIDALNTLYQLQNKLKNRW